MIIHVLNAAIAEKLPEAPLSRGQVELMKTNTVVAAGMPGFDAGYESEPA
jgi:hypothetical protein